MLDAATNSTSIQSMLENILIDYAQVTRKEKHNMFNDLDMRFSNSRVIAERRHVEVDSSIASGKLAKVPWIAFLDNRETTTTQKGVFCVFFFKWNFHSDMECVYLAFTQGVKEFTDKYGQTQRAREALRLRATTELRECTVPQPLRHFCAC